MYNLARLSLRLAVTWSCHYIDKGIETVARREYQVEPLSIHNTSGKLERRYAIGMQR